MIVPDGIEPVIGWRSWILDAENDQPKMQGGLIYWQNGIETPAPKKKKSPPPAPGKRLHSTGRTHVWEPGKAIHAECIAGNLQSKRVWTLAHGRGCEAYGETQFGKAPSLCPPPGFGWWSVEVKQEHGVTPDENCTCGIYATEDVTGVPGGPPASTPLVGIAAFAFTLQRSVWGAAPSPSVFGTVSLWGKVIPGDRGWRAEYAYPRELWVIESAKRSASLLAEDYSVPCHVIKDVKELVGVRV